MKNSGGYRRRGFTLIELSIVLVIIGLLVGGVLVGQDLIKAAGVRATITQIEKYNTAVNTFRAKFNALPGDIPSSLVVTAGFTTSPNRAGSQSRGDGNGLLEGYYYAGTVPFGWDETGEPLFFWEDLSSNSHLIDGGFNTAVDGPNTSVKPEDYFPAAKIGNSNFINVYSYNGINYFSLSGVSAINVNGNLVTSTNITVNQAFKIDSKVDDGLPTSGRVQAMYNNANYGGSFYGVTFSPFAAIPSSTTCFDTTSFQYSIAQISGNGPNCGLSFQFQ